MYHATISVSGRWLSTREHRRMVRLHSFSGVVIHELSLFYRHGNIGEWSVCVPFLALGYTSCRCSVDTDTLANGPSAFILWRCDSCVVAVLSTRAHRRMVRVRSFPGVVIHELSLLCRRGTSPNGPSAFLVSRYDS